jgi:hypothetical protein
MIPIWDENYFIDLDRIEEFIDLTNVINDELTPRPLTENVKLDLLVAGRVEPTGGCNNNAPTNVAVVVVTVFAVLLIFVFRYAAIAAFRSGET